MADTSEKTHSRWLWWAFLALCLAGFAAAADLARIHFRVHTVMGYQSFCAISQQMNCDTVADSDWSVFLGLPNAAWGMVGYLVMGVLAAWGLTRRTLSRTWPAGLLLLLSSFSVAVSIFLAVISKLVIHSMCVVCMASWAVAAGLFGLALAMCWRVGLLTAVRDDIAGLFSRPRLTAPLAVGAAVAMAALWLAYPRYWIIDGRVGPGSLGFGRDEGGLDWLGSKDPKLTVVVFSDYQCPHCAKAHEQARKLLEQNPELRVVHRDYPLDKQCNSGVLGRFHLQACERASAAACAGAEGKFWEMNDLLYIGQRRDLDLEVLAQRLQLDLPKFRACLSAAETRARLERDVEEARRLGVTGTPTFVLADKKYPGRVPLEEIEKALGKPLSSGD
jgi:uncharacterized membrane protein/predicted DsbA family dithiol-disulfide isomerase